MKNLFKLGFLALALSLTVVACSEKKADGADSTMTDTTITDTTMSMGSDTMMTDTMAKDTMTKM
ncbi:hypothetical protein QWY86_12730 [Pedobacter aquatilis]|uniref:hypothetical protein n=1 Tax=Pedobacter aquatilis TaxID=351343 RepID=UPI0025B581C1|nr:hypothetical protein [Pedobacter aquatilis]MDN3587540.1 hypothetical protein [Pedobacter aquatilis]